ncbi:MAG: hypothetical protein J3K34DRAFT_426699 [Monoraphidium minutum]|nr:MAG: hypothetical protein J3K34DRAFT_426699 [Monoraphidium minutum]
MLVPKFMCAVCVCACVPCVRQADRCTRAAREWGACGSTPAPRRRRGGPGPAPGPSAGGRPARPPSRARACSGGVLRSPAQAGALSIRGCASAALCGTHLFMRRPPTHVGWCGAAGRGRGRRAALLPSSIGRASSSLSHQAAPAAEFPSSARAAPRGAALLRSKH